MSETCPKCRGRVVAYTGAADSDKHCLICGFYIAAELAVVMPAIPPAGKEYSTHPAAVADRERRQRIKENGGPLRGTDRDRTREAQPRRPLTAEEKDYIRAAHQLGHNYAEIAAVINRPQNTIYNYVLRNGLSSAPEPVLEPRTSILEPEVSNPEPSAPSPEPVITLSPERAPRRAPRRMNQRYATPRPCKEQLSYQEETNRVIAMWKAGELRKEANK